MKTLLLSILWTALAVPAAAVNFDDEFADFPGFRYTDWLYLPQNLKNSALAVGYDQDGLSWNNPGQHALEQKAWDDLDAGTRGHLQDLGFDNYSWDCYVNHYAGLDWAQLEVRKMDQAAIELGYTKAIWESDQDPSAFQLSWGQLSDNQRWAAATFCWFHDTWDMIPIPDMGKIPVIYPYFRFVDWNEMSNTQQTWAGAVGWTEDTWNNPDSSDLDFTAFSELGEPQREALLKMGFYEEQYDCYINHYQGYDWVDLQDWGLDAVYETFGWTQFNYENGPTPTAWEGPWGDLTDEQKEAASEICWFEELWNGQHLSEFGQDFRFPEFRFVAWDKLSDKEQYLAASVGWVQATWDVPGTSQLENKGFVMFDEETQDNLRNLGFYTKDMFDCYVNHYEAYGWLELGNMDADIQNALTQFGWTQSSWDQKDYPDDYLKGWDDLSEEQLEAADYLCWFREIWDQAPLTSWSGAAWPTQRYWLWENLGEEEQNDLQSVGYTAANWNLPGDPSAEIEYTAWEELTPSQVDTLTWYGFYETQWNCYMLHYSDFNWFLLEKAGVTEYFRVFGWDKEAWQTNTPPESWSLKWDELSGAMKEAARSICYFKETWDDIPIDQWPLEVRTGSAFYDIVPTKKNPVVDNGGDGDSDESDDSGSGGGGAGLVFLFILLCACGAGGYFYCKRSKSSTFDPTAPIKEGPDLGQLTMSESVESDIDASRPYHDVDLDAPDVLPTIT